LDDILVKNNKIITASVVLFDTELNKVRIMLSSLELQAKNYKIYLYVIDHSKNKKYLNILKSIKVNIIYIHQKNYGYGAGHNVAIKSSVNSEFHVFLNPDISFDNLRFENLISHLKKEKSCIACSPMIKNFDDSYQFIGRPIPKIIHLFLRRFAPNLQITQLLNIRDLNSLYTTANFIKTPCFSGAFLFIRKNIFEIVNGFDERFFMYFEDIDLSIRIRKYGDIHYLKNESIYHHFARGSYYKFRLFIIHVLSLIKFKFKYLFNKQDDISEKKRIYIVSTSPFIIENFFKEHHAKLIEKYDVVIFTNFNNFKDIILNNKRLVAININIMRNIKILSDLFTLMNLFFIFLFFRPDMIISLGPKAGFLSGVAGLFSRIKSRVFIFQGQVWANKSGLFRYFLIFFDFLIAKTNNHLLSISSHEKKLLLKNKITYKDKINVLGNGSICGVDTTYPVNKSLKISKTDLHLDKLFIFSYIGRLTIDKGILDLLKSFENLSKKNTQIHLLLIGPDEMNINSYVNKNLNNISILPYQNDLTPFYDLTDCLILPSYREGLPITILEAFAAKVPVITSNIPSLKVMVKYNRGLFFKVKDVKSLEEKMNIILFDKNLRKKLSENAYTYVKHNFDKTKIVKKYIEYFESILHG
jgi:glycosyltransferase involved in cell wall biosynthesis